MSDKFLLTQTLLYVSARHIFISLTSFIENIIQDLPPNRIISFLEVYEQLMHFIVFPFFIKDLMNAGYMISS